MLLLRVFNIYVLEKLRKQHILEFVGEISRVCITLSRDIIDSRCRKSFVRVHTRLFHRPASFRVNARRQFGDSGGIMSRMVYTKGTRGELACARALRIMRRMIATQGVEPHARHSVVFPPPLPPVILSPRGLALVDEFLGVETMDHPTRIPSSRECVRADAARYSENVDDVSGRPEREMCITSALRSKSRRWRNARFLDSARLLRDVAPSLAHFRKSYLYRICGGRREPGHFRFL